MSWLSGDWSVLYRVTDRSEEAWFNDQSLRETTRQGVYRLVALTNDVDFDVMILDRVCGKDNSGTVYLGAARSLLGRVADLVATHHPDFKSKRHREMPTRLAKMLPPSRLAVCFQYVDADSCPFKRENQLMNAYYAKYGERPPLNRQG